MATTMPTATSERVTLCFEFMTKCLFWGWTRLEALAEARRAPRNLALRRGFPSVQPRPPITRKLQTIVSLFAGLLLFFEAQLFQAAERFFRRGLGHSGRLRHWLRGGL